MNVGVGDINQSGNSFTYFTRRNLSGGLIYKNTFLLNILPRNIVLQSPNLD